MIKKLTSMALFLSFSINLVACNASESQAPYLLLNLEQLYKTESIKKLANAAGKGDLKLAAKLLDNGVSVNGKGAYGMPVLFWPLRERNKKGFNFLLKRGANPNIQWNTGASIIELASGIEDATYLKMVLAEKGNPNLINAQSGKTPIFQAVKYGFRENVSILIKSGANIDAKNNSGRTPIFDAISIGDYSMALFLAEMGANLKLQDTWGKNLNDLILQRLDQPSEKDPEYQSYKKLISLINK